MHPLSTSARGSADDCDWVWKLPNEKRQPLMQRLMFPDPAVRLRLDSVEKASGLRHGGEVDAATFRPNPPVSLRRAPAADDAGVRDRRPA